MENALAVVFNYAAQGIPNPKSKIPNPKSKIQNPKSLSPSLQYRPHRSQVMIIMLSTEIRHVYWSHQDL